MYIFSPVTGMSALQAIATWTSEKNKKLLESLKIYTMEDRCEGASAVGVDLSGRTHVHS